MSSTWSRRIGEVVTIAVILTASPAVFAQEHPRIIVVMLDEVHRSSASSALATEIAGRQAKIFATDPPRGETTEERAVEALWVADEVGATAALWVERRSRGRHSVVAALTRDDGDLRDAPLPSAPETLDPRAFAIIAATLIDELLEPLPTPPTQVEPLEVEVPVRRSQPTPLDPPRPRLERPPRDWLDVGLEMDMAWRSFDVAIDPICDTAGRNEAVFRSAFYPELGLRLAFHPGELFTSSWLANLGVDVAYHHHVHLVVLNRRRNTEVDAEQWSLSVGLRYRAVIGTPSVGVTLIPRIGFHLYEFFLGDEGNDIVPPFTYQALSLGLDIEIPLRTRWVALDLGGHYLPVLSVGESATEAYNASGERPTAHGYRVTAGLGGPIVAGLRWRLGFEVIGHVSHHSGKGRGWGVDPSTECDDDCATVPDCSTVGGIMTTDSASDRHFRVVFGFSYRVIRRRR